MSRRGKRDGQEIEPVAPRIHGAETTRLMVGATRLSDYGTIPNEVEQPLFSPKSFEAGVHVDGIVQRTETRIDRGPLACLLLQHVSSVLSTELYQFASFIFLVDVYENTLAPGAIVGLTTTACGMFFAGYVGGIVDRTSRLKFVRAAVMMKKIITAINYGLFLLLLGPLRHLAAASTHLDTLTRENLIIWSTLGIIVLFSAAVHLVNIGINVAIERDWVTTIAQGDANALTRLNASMTSIDVFSRIFGPLLVSVLTASFGYSGAAKVLIGFGFITLLTEYYWLQVVYNRFPILLYDEQTRRKFLDLEYRRKSLEAGKLKLGVVGRVKQLIKDEKETWGEYTSMPIFWTSLSSAFTYLTSLTFDAVGVAHFKMAAGYSDGFLGAMRGLAMLCCLIGTVIMPKIEGWVGTKRAGILGLSSGIVCFIPVTIAFFLEDTINASNNHTYKLIDITVMFSGIIIARAGHITFDLSQIKLLQQTLEPHPRRNRLTALQSSLQSLCGLLKFGACLVFSTPELFKWTVLMTLLANLGAATSYITYLRLVKSRKHQID